MKRSNFWIFIPLAVVAIFGWVLKSDNLPDFQRAYPVFRQSGTLANVLSWGCSLGVLVCFALIWAWSSFGTGKK